MTARDLLQILRGGWAVIVLCTMAFTAVGAIYSSTRTPQYLSTSTLAVSACVAVENLDSCDYVSGLTYAVERAKIYSGTALSAPVLRLALENSDVVSDRKELSEAVSVAQQSGSPLIEVSASYHDPRVAAELANALANALIEYSRESIDNFESAGTHMEINVVSPALAPLEPLDGENRIVLLTGVLGFLLGFGVVVLRRIFNTRLRDTFDAERVSGLDVLAELPLRKTGKRRELDRGSARVTDAFHGLRAIVASRRPDKESWTIAVVTPTDAALATAVAEGLAASLASSKQSVTLFHLHGPCAVESDQGSILEVLNGTVSPLVYLDEHGDMNPVRIALATGLVEPAAALSTPEFTALLESARARSVFLLLDAAPESRGAEMVSAAAQADATLVIVESGTTRAQELSRTIRALELVQAPPIGIVVVSPRDRRG